MTPPSTIEQVGTEAVDSIMPIMARAFDPLYGEAWTAIQCAGVLSLPGSLLLVALSDGKAVGFSLSRRVLDEAELMLLAVHPDAQGKGIGAALLAQCIARAQHDGVGLLHLEMRADNPARRFYISHGFVEVGKRRNYYLGLAGKRTDAVTFSRKLR